MKTIKSIRRGLLFTAAVGILATPLLLSGIGGCGGGESACNAVTEEGCEAGQVCEEVAGGGTECFSPVLARGTVFNLADASPIEGARVVALDANGSPVSTVGTTDINGNYEIEVPTRRNEDGTPAGDDFTLRADAASFQTFPAGLRQPIPIDTSNPTNENGTFVIDNQLTDVGLIALEPGFGTASLFGSVELPENSRGALVVAESSPTTGFSAIADRDGNYRIFNLVAGTYNVKAYVQGANHNTENTTLADAEEKEVNLSLNGDAPSTLNGNVQIVNAPGGSVTSVILVVESTLNEVLARGEVPPGLRAPAPGTAPNISGSYTIEGVPSGRYVILAAFENDNLVRDPDLSIGGTDILHIETSSGSTVTAEGFKVTEALNVLSPGAAGIETIVGNPTFQWADDSSEDSYHLVVVDSFGNIVCEFDSPKFTGGGNPSEPYPGACPALIPSSFYQFRVSSIKDGIPISQTEDLEGVFFVQ